MALSIVVGYVMLLYVMCIHVYYETSRSSIQAKLGEFEYLKILNSEYILASTRPGTVLPAGRPAHAHIWFMWVAVWLSVNGVVHIKIQGGRK